MRSRTLMRFLASSLVTLAAATTEAGGAQRLAVVAPGELRGLDTRIAQLQQAGALRVHQVRQDTLLPDRQHVRLAQYHQGVPVWGGELVRQSSGGDALSVFGTYYEGIELDVRPALSSKQALATLGQKGARPFGSKGQPQLVVLPREGGYTLAWKVRALLPEGDIRVYFVDARSGAIAHEYSDLQSQAAAVGSGTGVLNDRKKVSARQLSGAFVTDDQLRPPHIRTFDFKGDLFRFIDVLVADDFVTSDLARDTDNTWTDGAAVDAHVYAGHTYDYYFKRFGRHGLDNGDIPVRSMVHPVNRADVFNYPGSIVDTFYLNAFYLGDGLMLYGEGLPPDLKASDGKHWNYLAGALDVVSHELTHGVTDYSSGLIYQGESGALNEAFSDIMATGVEHYFQEVGSGALKADYLLAEDVVTPGGLRSMQNPAAYGDPDHYSLRYTGSEDNGGVHSNSGIANHAFYLAIEGGRNRVSGLGVEGVGAANREQIEKVFYRAFVFMLPPSANFSSARAATIQAARDLYGAGSRAESAVVQAWTAVGVQ